MAVAAVVQSCLAVRRSAVPTKVLQVVVALVSCGASLEEPEDAGVAACLIENWARSFLFVDYCGTVKEEPEVQHFVDSVGRPAAALVARNTLD